jgi:polyphosphate kinase
MPRLVPVKPLAPDELVLPDEQHFVWVDEIIAANLDRLFPGMEIEATYPFRVTRNTDMEIQEEEADDLLLSIEENLRRRHFGFVVRLEIDQSMPDHIRNILISNLQIGNYDVYRVNGPLDLTALYDLHRLELPRLKDVVFQPSLPASLRSSTNIFSTLRSRDILLHHPYDSFLPVVDFVEKAADDPEVLAIKQTLYRVGPNPPIVHALMRARENGKQVSVLVELKARFDEENNIVWARALEAEGVHVVYGVMRLKTHDKMCLVVRREPDGIRRYVHLGTGNYNAVTSRLYTDLGYFTCEPDIGADVAELFNALTGYSRQQSYRKLLVAPGTMRQEVLRRIEREIDRQREHRDGYIAFKMNALVDPKCIQALYRASQAGVRIELQVRGICCLRPQIPGVSESITVTSVVGRFLEHSRIYYFRNGGEEDVLLGSADLMPRNLDRRVEVLFPVEEASARHLLVQDILQTHLRDNVQSWRLFPDGHYERCDPSPGEPEISSQLWMLEHWNT